MQMTAEKVLTRLMEHAERIKNDEHQTAGAMAPGDAWAQGDVGVVCLNALPDTCEPVDQPSAQVAPGNTQGSRHVLESLHGLKIYRLSDANALEGPVIDARECGMRLNHPEHGDTSFGPGIYAVVYQRQLAEELKAVRD